MMTLDWILADGLNLSGVTMCSVLFLCSPSTDSVTTMEELQRDFADQCIRCSHATKKGRRLLLSPCGCTVCFRCVIAFLAEGRMSWACPSCSKKIFNSESIDSFQWEGAEMRDGRKVEVIKTVTVQQNLRENLDPVRLYVRNEILQDEDGNRRGQGAIKEKIGAGILFTAMHCISWDDEKNQLKVSGGNDFALSLIGEYPPGSHEQIRLLTCATLLHAALRPMCVAVGKTRGAKAISPEAEDESTNSSSSNQIDCYTYDSFLLRVLANYSIMHLFVYALATGNKFPRITGAEDDDEMPNIDDIDISGTNVSTYFLSQLSSCAVATDLILRAGNHEEVGEALKFLSFQIQHSKESQMKDILSKLRLTYSRSHEVKWRSREYRERVIDPATAIGTRDLILASADNVQWRYGNKYDHWVAILLHALIETEMLRRGILNDDDPSKRLSRERVDYRE